MDKCWASVLSAKKSTPCNSLAIILLRALLPAPPTPTTKILGANSCSGDAKGLLWAMKLVGGGGCDCGGSDVCVGVGDDTFVSGCFNSASSVALLERIPPLLFLVFSPSVFDVASLVFGSNTVGVVGEEEFSPFIFWGLALLSMAFKAFSFREEEGDAGIDWYRTILDALWLL